MTRFDTALAQIRAHTRSLHAELEALVRKLGLFSSHTGLAGHITALLSHHTLAAQRTLGSPDIHAWIMERVDDLRHDLALLEITMPSVDHLSCPAAWDQTIEDEARGAPAGVADGLGFPLGEAYVVEGSRLGAEVIARTLKQNGVWNEKLRFTSDSGVAVGKRWRRFQELLTSLDANEWDHASAAAAASFRRLLLHYQKLDCVTIESPRVRLA